MSLRDKVHAYLTANYQSTDRISVRDVANRCGPVNTVAHILYAFAEEGLIDQLIPIECPCGTTSYATESDVRDGRCKCVNCNRMVDVTLNLSEQQFVYFMK